jgi:hypothetical protein
MIEEIYFVEIMWFIEGTINNRFELMKEVSLNE